MDYRSPEFVWDVAAEDGGTQNSVQCGVSKIAVDGSYSNDLGDAILGMEVDGSHSNLGGDLY